MRAGITGAKRIHAVEGALRTTVPEIAVVEDRIDDRRRVARRGPANVDGAAIAVRNAPDGISDASFIFRGLAKHHVVKVEPEHTLRTHNVVVVASRGVKREVTQAQGMVGSEACVESCRVCCRIAVAVNATQARVSLVSSAAVRACVEMAGRTGCFAVAAKLHFPEESFAQSDSRVLVFNDVGKFSRSRAWDSDSFQRSKTAAVVTAAAVSAFSATTCFAATAISALAFLSASLDAAISTLTALATVAILTTAASPAALGGKIGDAE